ncbi:hypothetical protein JOQ06_006405, partial [Pogonophryne albipinna]
GFLPIISNLENTGFRSPRDWWYITCTIILETLKQITTKRKVGILGAGCHEWRSDGSEPGSIPIPPEDTASEMGSSVGEGFSVLDHPSVAFGPPPAAPLREPA